MSTSYSQIQRVLASDPNTNDFFGQTIALSTHGHMALIGRPNFNTGTGAVSVFTYSHSDARWSDQFEITASDLSVDDFFGSSIALNSNSLVAVIGAHQTGLNSGKAYVFINSDTFWIQQQRLIASDGNSSDQFGCSVATSAQGHTILVGAQNAQIGSYLNQGAVYIFEYNGTSWLQSDKIFDTSVGPSMAFGTAVAMSSTDNTTALIGAPQPTTGDNGLAFIYTQSDNSWARQYKIENPNTTTGANFGISVALLGSGETQLALVGANSDTINGNIQQGAAYVFMRSDGTWPLQKRLLASDGMASDQFGSSVSLGKTPEGRTIALIGAPGRNKSYIFENAENGWKQIQEIAASDNDLSGNFGNAVTLAGHGLTGLIGDSGFPNNSDQGAAYFFQAPSSFTLAPSADTSLIKFLPDILITIIVLYGGIVSMFLLNASED